MSLFEIYLSFHNQVCITNITEEKNHGPEGGYLNESPTEPDNETLN